MQCHASMGVGNAQAKSVVAETIRSSPAILYFIDIPEGSSYTFSMAIPRIIHQTWKSDRLPPLFRMYQETWRRLHPGWEYRFYDDAACRRIVESHFPDLLALYDGCPHPVQRADIFRYLIVAREGGLYADMDMECLRNLDPLLEGQRAVFGVEDRLSPRRTRQLGHRYAERVANFIFASEADHPVWGKVIGKLKGLPGAWDLTAEVLETTGPGMLTNVVLECRQSLGLTVLPRICWAPPNRGYPDCFPFNLHVYARHHFAGTWKKNRSAPRDAGGLRCRLRRWDLGEIIYKLPPSPVWKSDLLFWRKEASRR
jgi:inositol phosphorylceramide mannosyltransferase catalytic subunit